MRRDPLRSAVVGSLVAGAVIGSAVLAAYWFKPNYAVQTGYRGVGMETVETRASLRQKLEVNKVPMPLPAASQEGQLASEVNKNVQVLGHLPNAEFTRVMTAMTTWVAPEEGCAYCHAPLRDAAGVIQKDEDGYTLADTNNMYSDELYTKRVARKMLQMTLQINGNWQAHVKQTGVTCYTCHRGQPVPKNLWFNEPQSPADGLLGNSAGQNHPAALVGLSALPTDVNTPFLNNGEDVRIISTGALPDTNRSSIKQAEYTYGLMMEMSDGLGVNCTYCHNTRSMAAWDTSPPARATAWYGIRMVRELNKNYLEGLGDVFPPNRLGPLGDVPKINCATCHQQAFKPLLGVSMLKEYQSLAKAGPHQPQPAPVEPTEAPPTGTPESGPNPMPPPQAPPG